MERGSCEYPYSYGLLYRHNLETRQPLLYAHKKWSLTQRNKLVIYAGKINKGKKVKYEGVVSRNSE